MRGRASSSRVHKWKCFLGHGCPGGRSLDTVERKQDRSKTMSSTVADLPHSTQEAQAQEVGCGLHEGTPGRRFEIVLATKASIHGLSSRESTAPGTYVRSIAQTDRSPSSSSRGKMCFCHAGVRVQLLSLAL